MVRGLRYSRNPNVLWRSTSCGPVVLAPQDDRPARLGGAAAVVWEVLDVALDAAGIAGAAAELTLDAAGVDGAVTWLAARGLIEVQS